MNRRALLTAAPALALLPAASAVATEDPILPHYREWLAAKIEWQRWCDAPGNENWDCPESRAADAREDVAFEAMMQTRATTMEGMAALVHVLWMSAGPKTREGLPEYAEECAFYEHRPMVALWRSATGQEGLPRQF